MHAAATHSRGGTISSRNPARRRPETGEHNLVELDSVERQAVQTRAVRHVVVDGFGKRIRLLKHHTHTRTKLDHIDVVYVDVLPLKLDELGNDD